MSLRNCFGVDDFEDFEASLLRHEFAPWRKPFRCSDRMCGGDDCANCHPEHEREEDEE